MKRSSKRAWLRGIVVVVLLAVVAVAWWQYWPPGGTGPQEPNAADANTGKRQGDRPGPGPSTQADANTAAGAGATTRPLAPANGEILKLQKLRAAEVMKMVGKGNQLVAAKKLAEGRAELSKALLSGKLPPATEQSVRETLTELAGRMIFSRDVFDGDPYVGQYTFQTGEVLMKVERKLKLHVPTQILLKVNGVRDARSIRAGQTIKVVHGPFHAVVSKGKFTMDIYLRREGCPPAYVRRLKVGLGKNGTTPVGLWRVGLGRKLIRAPWNPPPNSPVKRSIAWGEPDYPLGKMGYWLGLAGIDQTTRMHEGYGIHGTNDPSSIGRAESLGCIRLADADIELVFFLLYEKWSTVRVRA